MAQITAFTKRVALADNAELSRLGLTPTDSAIAQVQWFYSELSEAEAAQDDYIDRVSSTGSAYLEDAHEETPLWTSYCKEVQQYRELWAFEQLDILGCIVKFDAVRLHLDLASVDHGSPLPLALRSAFGMRWIDRNGDDVVFSHRGLERKASCGRQIGVIDYDDLPLPGDFFDHYDTWASGQTARHREVIDIDRLRFSYKLLLTNGLLARL